MKIEITEKELNDIFKKDILKHLTTTIEDNMLGYWVRDKVYESLSEKLISEIIETHFNKKEIRDLVKEAIKRKVDEKFDI